MRADLELELLQAAAAMPASAAQQLLAMGVPQAEIAQWRGAGLLGTAQVELSADGSTWYPGGPDRRLLLGVLDLLPDGAGGADWQLVDIVALASRRRDEWALRTGDGWALGIDNWHAALQADDEATVFDLSATQRSRRPELKLRLFASPWDWLAAGCSGICVLDWTPLALTALRSLGQSVTIQTNPGVQDRLRGLLAHGGLPRVEAARVVRGIAA